MGSTKQKIIIAVCSLVLLLSPAFASARGLVPCGGFDPNLPGGIEKPCTVKDIFVLVAKVTNFLIAMAGVFAVYEIIGGGFWLIVSMGKEEDITKRKGQITNAVIGMVLVLFAFMFVNTVVNFILVRSLGTPDNRRCALNLRDPLTYLSINQDQQCAKAQ
jgi:hypothetical protein